jgi:hypothetical protein
MRQQQVRIKAPAIPAAGHPLCARQTEGEAERSGGVDEACGLGAGVLEERPLLAGAVLSVKKKANLTIFGAGSKEKTMGTVVVAPEMIEGDDVVQMLTAEEENHEDD